VDVRRGRGSNERGVGLFFDVAKMNPGGCYFAALHYVY